MADENTQDQNAAPAAAPTSPTVTELQALLATAQQDGTKAALTKAIADARADAESEVMKLKDEAEKFWDNIEQHLSETGLAVYTRLKPYL